MATPGPKRHVASPDFFLGASFSATRSRFAPPSAITAVPIAVLPERLAVRRLRLGQSPSLASYRRLADENDGAEKGEVSVKGQHGSHVSRHEVRRRRARPQASRHANFPLACISRQFGLEPAPTTQQGSVRSFLILAGQELGQIGDVWRRSGGPRRAWARSLVGPRSRPCGSTCRREPCGLARHGAC
jgi:hypothetical protein